MTLPETATAFELAVNFGLSYWPERCPVCGQGDAYGRRLDSTPGDRGRARYRCMSCSTTFTRSTGEVRRILRRHR